MAIMFFIQYSKGGLADWFRGTEEEFLAIEKFHLKVWKLNGEFNREGGPAAIWSDGYQMWYQNGKYHRIDGPAVIYANGSESWYQNGKWHRGDGPAVICSNGQKEWYIEGLEFINFFDQFFPMINYAKNKYPGE